MKEKKFLFEIKIYSPITALLSKHRHSSHQSTLMQTRCPFSWATQLIIFFNLTMKNYFAKRETLHTTLAIICAITRDSSSTRSAGTITISAAIWTWRSLRTAFLTTQQFIDTAVPRVINSLSMSIRTRETRRVLHETDATSRNFRGALRTLRDRDRIQPIRHTYSRHSRNPSTRTVSHERESRDENSRRTRRGTAENAEFDAGRKSKCDAARRLPSRARGACARGSCARGACARGSRDRDHRADATATCVLRHLWRESGFTARDSEKKCKRIIF